MARFDGGVVTREEMDREARRLPPALREQFVSEAGQREFAWSLVDKRLLVEEARRRGLSSREDIARQVRELEERLVVQELLAEETKAAGTPGEQELRAWYEANRDVFAQPERLHLGRVLARFENPGNAADRARARGRAEQFARRLQAKEPLSQVQSSGDGPERARNGDLGLFARGELPDRRMEEAAFALQTPGQVSPVVETAEGFAVLQLLERRPARTPPFEEVRAEVEGRVAPVRQRKVFDALRARLRSGSDVQVEVTARP
ncbi:peptidyl-prolyl cis-trans isomerase [Corallococcus exiguus]|uniref:peptidylprolyl isomerase n=1 Tax=Corallococcus TaxID=83461 RepID=UPI0011C4465F|nr:peptidylprolyl isomerase [Corallococcus sp. AB038B]NNB93405.1 peptidyl-prolyl cis-trans isomerase [Corallococcus exiguus]NNC02019.1 peptidyl-prolyl cis-trans isomerase [Corallococcus exiguus]NPC70905.1 peptidyl-prolyl cis-trans isomerase [Corallococcus exiguus]